MEHAFCFEPNPGTFSGSLHKRCYYFLISQMRKLTFKAGLELLKKMRLNSLVDHEIWLGTATIYKYVNRLESVRVSTLFIHVFSLHECTCMDIWNSSVCIPLNVFLSLIAFKIFEKLYFEESMLLTQNPEIVIWLCTVWNHTWLLSLLEVRLSSVVSSEWDGVETEAPIEDLIRSKEVAGILSLFH